MDCVINDKTKNIFLFFYFLDFTISYFSCSNHQPHFEFLDLDK